MEVVRLEQAWVADITYVRLQVEFVCLAVLMDVFRGKSLPKCVRQRIAAE